MSLIADFDHPLSQQSHPPAFGHEVLLRQQKWLLRGQALEFFIIKIFTCGGADSDFYVQRRYLANVKN
ncbi:hypothetical protein [Candidatus Methylobacter favarea]|uniref:hypothetical protein n=1 Tax=Candidatus Methylobacter favarea TaxID=2707345 RepID=UPI00157CFFEC|nr:hypothetical protein [Candidatus Methylobacter favarea]